MNHSFNVEIATKLWVEKAILIENILFWWRKDKANNHNLHDWKYRVYNSSSAFAKLFPYMSQISIKRYLKDLVDTWYFETWNYNKMAFDKTLWYTPTDKLLSMVWEDTIDGIKMTHGQYQSDPTIPVINPIINPVNNNMSFSEFWSAYPHFRKWKKPDAKQHYEKKDLTHEEIMQEVKILKRKNHTEISKVQFNPWCHLWIRDITKTSEVVLIQTLKEIVKTMKPQQIFVKNKELMDDFPDIDIKWMFRALDDDKLLKSIKAML